MARPKKTPEELEATRLAAVARRREQRAAARAASQSIRPRGRPRKAPDAGPAVAVAKPPVAVVEEPPKSTWDSLGPRERREFLRAAIDDAGRSPLDVADELDISRAIVAKWYRDATGRALPDPEREARKDESAIRDLEQRKLAELERQRKIRQLSTSIGELPSVKHPGIKVLCRFDLHLFLQWYFPASTGLGPFGGPQLSLIDRFALACQHPSRFLSVLSRGFVKTTISVHALLWAALFGHSLNSVFLAANDDLASESIGSIKRELMFNSRLADDFPEVCHPIRALDNKPQRAMSQSFEGHLTMPEWTGDTIVLPTIPGSPASGCILQSKGLEAASRGLSYKRIDGRNVRPTLVVIDDAQTDKSAKSIPEIRKRSDIIRKGVSRLGGHGAKCSIVLNGTPLQPNDLIEQLSDRSKHPGWSKIRCPMFPVMPAEDQLREHWLGPYAAILTGFSDDDIDSQVRAERAATEYYIEHREAMDAGFEVAWPSIPTEPNEISAIQHGMNIRILEGADVFAAECQLSPINPQLASVESLDSELIAQRYSGIPQGIVPDWADLITAAVDIQGESLWWLLAGWQRETMRGHIIDFGVFPDQGTDYVLNSDIRLTLADQFGVDTFEQALERGLIALSDILLGQQYAMQSGGSLGCSMLAIDANWSQSADLVYQVARQRYQGKILPTIGRYVGATGATVDQWRGEKGDKRGPGWILQRGRRQQLHSVFDANQIKSWIAGQLSAEVGISLPGDSSTELSMLADNLSAEFGTQIEAKTGRKCTEWKRKPGRDNHFFDGLVMSAVAASISGGQLPGQAEPKQPRKRWTAEEIQRKRRSA